jgi:hypothetical protein
MGMRAWKPPAMARFRLVAPPSPRRARRSGWLAGPAAALLLALCSIGHGAWAEDEWVEEEPSWVPSLRFGFDTFEYSTQATVENTLNPPKNQGTQNSKQRLFMFQLGGELMGPMLGEFPGHPRLFVQAGVQFKPFSSDSIFQIGVDADPEKAVNDFQINLANAKARFPNTPDNWPLLPETFTGEGSTIDADFQNVSWSGALGVAFTFPVADSALLELKPSIAYNIDRIDMSGSITTVLDTGETKLIFVDLPGPGRESFQSVPVLEVNRGAASTSVTQHSLGPGIELGLVLFRSSRPIRASLYADARFLWLLSSPNTSFSDSISSYSVHRDPFEIRGGAGVRFSWVGFGGR